MNKQSFVHWLALVAAVAAFAAVVLLVGAEVYVRWGLNQNFTFLGGAGLPALMMLFLGLMLGLLYSTRS